MKNFLQNFYSCIDRRGVNRVNDKYAARRVLQVKEGFIRPKRQLRPLVPVRKTGAVADPVQAIKRAQYRAIPCQAQDSSATSKIYEGFIMDSRKRQVIAVAEDGEEIVIEKQFVQVPHRGIISFTTEYRSEGFILSRRWPSSFIFLDGPRCGKIYSVDPVAFPDF